MRELDDALRSAGVGGRVVLVTGPAGAGKTELLAEHARCLAKQSTAPSIAWLTVGDLHNNSRALCGAIMDAVGLGSGLADSVAPFESTGADVDYGALGSELASAVGRIPRDIHLVIDDAHLLYDPVALAMLDGFIDAAPGNLALVVAGRYEPPLAWPRIELQGRLARFDGAFLAFDQEEMARLFAGEGLTLGREELAAVVKATEGWCAMVVFAAATLKGGDDHEQALLELLATPRPVADYLVGEIFSLLQPKTLDFMMRTSLVDRFSIDLAESLTNLGAANELEVVERLGLPVIRTFAVGIAWYSYHPILRSHLRAEVLRTQAGSRAALHGRAAAWLERHQLYEEAFAQYLQVHEGGEIEAFLVRKGIGLLIDGREEELSRILDQVPDDVANDPAVRLLQAALALEHIDLATARTYLEFIPPGAELEAGQRLLSTMLEIEIASAAADEPPVELLALADSGGAIDAGLATYVGFAMANVQTLLHRFDEALETLARVAVLADAGGHARAKLKALTGMAICAGVSGNIAEMGSRSEYGCDFAVEHEIDGGEAELCAAVAAVASYLRCTSGELDNIPNATELAQTSVLGARRPKFGWHSVVACGLHEMDTGDEVRRAAAATRDAMIKAIDSGLFPFATHSLLPIVVHAFINVGEVDWAARVTHDSHRKFGDSPSVWISRAAINHESGRLRDAAADISAIPNGDALLANGVYAHILGAVIAADQNQARAVREELTCALELSAPSRTLRPFLDHGDALRPILNGLAGHFGDSEQFAHEVRARIGEGVDAVGPRLTACELKVLRQLVSGDTTQSIANELCLSVNTVKTHLRSIYRKLGVGNRREALTTARGGGLL